MATTIIRAAAHTSKRPVLQASTLSDPLVAGLRGKRVVIVEDEGITQMQLRVILKGAGLEIAGAVANGKDAIELVLAEKPDLVLMDIKMPVMDGLEATRRILAQSHMCIVMLTAYDDYREEADTIGATGYVVKPIDRLTLLPQLAAALQRFTAPPS